MRVKTVKRFYCDFCKKANLQAFAMANHELHCTLNPNRECRACGLINGGNGCNLTEATDLLPDPTSYHNNYSIIDDVDIYNKLVSEIKDSLPLLRDYTENCPACILAALRQKKIPVPMAQGFDFKEEMKEVFSAANKNRIESGYGYYY